MPTHNFTAQPDQTLQMIIRHEHQSYRYQSVSLHKYLPEHSIFLMQLQQSVAVRGHRAHSTTWRPPPSKTLRAGKQLWLAQIWDNTRQVCLGKKKNRKNAAFLYLRIASNQKYPCLPPLTADFRYCKALQRL